MGPVAVMLPGGAEVGGVWHREAWLMPITGHEEEFLLGEARSMRPAARVTALLARCLRGLGPAACEGEPFVRQLGVGDRDALLFHLRRLALGDRISCVLDCPECAKKMDLDTTVTELLAAPYPDAAPLHEAVVEDADGPWRVLFRLPNGEDQEVAASIAGDREDVLLRRCVARVEDAGGREVCTIPEGVKRDLPARMARLDPQAELLFDLECPECGAKFVAPFDIADYLFREFSGNEREFYRGVHALSFHYHWDERAVLDLPTRKRQIYLDLLREELAEGAS